MKARGKITAVDCYVPLKVVTNHDLAKVVDTSHEWIVERTGIVERHIAERGIPSSELAVNAVQKMLRRRNIDADEIDLIIVATVTPDMFFPSTACIIQDKIRATHAWGFDLSAASAGFLYGLTVGAQFIQNGAHSKVVVIGVDVMSSILNPADRSTLVLFGDGAGAVLLEPSESERFGILDFFHEIDGSGSKLLYIPGGGSLNPTSQETVAKEMHYLHQNGKALFKHAVRQLERICRTILDRNGLNVEDVDIFIMHQANLRIINAVSERLGLTPNKVIVNIHKYGNTSAATIPLALNDVVIEGRVKEGDLVLFAAVGAGYTASSLLLRWA